MICTSTKMSHPLRCGSSLSRHRISRVRQDDAWPFSDSHRDECGSFGKDFDVTFDSVLKKAAQSCPSIAMDYDVLCGSPRIAGTRIPVYMVVDAVQHYGTIEGARKSYPELTTEQVKEALCFAGTVLEQPSEYEP
jgi:uncharacterized protein (DUF433 family)